VSNADASDCRSARCHQTRPSLHRFGFCRPFFRAVLSIISDENKRSIAALSTTLPKRLIERVMLRLRIDASFGHLGTQPFIAGLRCFALTARWILTRLNRAAFDCYFETSSLPPSHAAMLSSLTIWPSTKAKELPKFQDHGDGSSSCRPTP
jgi:hypothetical protein